MVVSPGVPINRHPIAPRAGGEGAADRATSSCSRRPGPTAAAQGGRHHRHQRQVDHHRAVNHILKTPASDGMGGNIGSDPRQDPLPRAASMF
jgi:hypothetical protein